MDIAFMSLVIYIAIFIQKRKNKEMGFWFGFTY